MPRVDNQGKNVSHWYDNEGGGNGSSTYDVCADCATDLSHDPHYYNDILTPFNGDPQGEDGWVDDGCCHPSYTNGDDYFCAVCNKLLTEDDEDELCE